MLIIDRFEGEFALCEDEGRQMRRIPRAELPAQAREGDCLTCEEGRLRIDSQAAEARRKANAARFRRLTRGK